MESFPGDRLEGIGAQHPFLPRTVMVLTAEFVTMDSGTGAVHIAPGHGEDDYVLGSKNSFPILSPVDDHGRYTNEVGIPELVGKYVFDANADIIRILRDKGMLLAEQNFHHTYPYCWRSKTPIIFRAVEQFFIRLDEIRGKALDAIHHHVKWVPSWGENRIAGTVESRPDWVISRQRSWGVPLPVFYIDERATLNADWIRKLADLVAKRGSNVWFELSDAELARELGIPEGTTKRNDTIDVWIDSGVSHRAVCATRPELRDPADMYLEATDQHRGWFQSSLMTSIALNDRAPYKMCLTHGFVVDLDGKKISKSGTYDKPMDAGHFVKKYGADLIRLWASSINFGDDVPFSEEMFTRLGDTYRRIRNTLRILLGNLFDFVAADAVRGLGSATPASPPAPKLSSTAGFSIDSIMSSLNVGTRMPPSSSTRFITASIIFAPSISAAFTSTSLRIGCIATPRIRRAAVLPKSQCIEFSMPFAVCSRRFSSSRRKRRGAMLCGYCSWRRRGRPAVTDPGYKFRPPAIVPGNRRRSARCSRRASKSINCSDSVASSARRLEKARQEKLIGNSLEARVTLKCDRKLIGAISKEELEEFFILSDLIIEDATEPSATVEKTPFAKCARCWRHRESVGQSSAHPDLCDRCEKVAA